MVIKQFGSLCTALALTSLAATSCGPADEPDEAAGEEAQGSSARQALRNPGFNGNTVYGYWQGSGGQNPSSPSNRVFLVNHEGTAATLTFTLTSSASETHVWDSAAVPPPQATSRMGATKLFRTAPLIKSPPRCT